MFNTIRAKLIALVLLALAVAGGVCGQPRRAAGGQGLHGHGVYPKGRLRRQIHAFSLRVGAAPGRGCSHHPRSIFAAGGRALGGRRQQTDGTGYEPYPPQREWLAREASRNHCACVRRLTIEPGSARLNLVGVTAATSVAAASRWPFCAGWLAAA